MILVTGAGGQLGTAVIRALAARGQSVRALVRSAHAVERARTAGAGEVVWGDMTSQADLLAAAQDVHAICHITPSQSSSEVRMAECVIAAGQASQVDRLLYFGSINLLVETEQHRDKRRVEAMIVASRLPYIFLHPAKFMQGILPLWPDIIERGVMCIPYSPTSPIARVDLMDVGDAAAEVLLHSGHYGATYELVGQPPITEEQMGEVLARSLGRPVRVEQISADHWSRDAAARGVGPEQIRRSLQMFDFFTRIGSPHETVHTLSWLIGRQPSDFEAFVQRLRSSAGAQPA
jgi:uncharacterized protein YbjT (DUF2867 family)